MRIEFDPEEDRINHEKHGLSLAAAAEMDLATAAIIPAERYDYGEARYLGRRPARWPAAHSGLYDARRHSTSDLLAKGERKRKEAL